MTDKFQRIHTIWNWLPAFRAVAETEHLPSASSMIHVSASALSRAIGQLEDYFGHELFDREGRSMELNERGERLLKAVRRSMRTIDDAIDANLDDTYRGALNWTGSWSLSSVALEGVSRFVGQYPEVVPKMRALEPDKVGEQLLKGKLDLAVITYPVDLEELEATPLARLPHSIYCSKGHPLFGQQDVEWVQLENRRYAAPPPNPAGEYLDGWPPGRQRDVVMEFEQMSVGYRACRDEGLLAVLPDLVAEDEPGLWPLKSVSPKRYAYAVRRVPVSENDPVQTLVEHLQSVFDNRISVVDE